jgi:hypothetical protein
MHKHPYPPPLNVKVSLPQSQTLPIVPTAREAAVVAVPLRNPKHPTAPARARKQPAVINSKIPILPPLIDLPPLIERRSPGHRLDRHVGLFSPQTLPEKTPGDRVAAPGGSLFVPNRQVRN